MDISRHPEGLCCLTGQMPYGVMHDITRLDGDLLDLLYNRTLAVPSSVCQWQCLNLRQICCMVGSSVPQRTVTMSRQTCQLLRSEIGQAHTHTMTASARSQHNLQCCALCVLPVHTLKGSFEVLYSTGPAPPKHAAIMLDSTRDWGSMRRGVAAEERETNLTSSYVQNYGCVAA